MRSVNTFLGEPDDLGVGTEEILPGKALGQVLRVEEDLVLRELALERFGGSRRYRGFDNHDSLAAIPNGTGRISAAREFWCCEHPKRLAHRAEVRAAVGCGRRRDADENNLRLVDIVAKALPRVYVVEKQILSAAVPAHLLEVAGERRADHADPDHPYRNMLPLAHGKYCYRSISYTNNLTSVSDR